LSSFYVPFFIVESLLLFSFCFALLLCRRFVVGVVGSTVGRFLVRGSPFSCLFLVVLLYLLSLVALDRSFAGNYRFFTIIPPSSQLPDHSSS